MSHEYRQLRSARLSMNPGLSARSIQTRESTVRNTQDQNQILPRLSTSSIQSPRVDAARSGGRTCERIHSAMRDFVIGRRLEGIYGATRLYRKAGRSRWAV